MVGCGGFGAAKAGAAIMERAAAKEPAMVALVNALLEFMGVILIPEISGIAGRRRGARAGLKANPDPDVTSVTLLYYRLRPHNPVMKTGSATIAMLLRFHGIGRFPIGSRRRLRYWLHRSTIMHAGW